MNRIGRVLHISPSGKAVLKAEKIPRIGDIVLNGEGQVVGKVFDIIGPVKAPYVEVEINYSGKIIGRMLYASSKQRKKKRGKKRRGK